MAKGYSRVDALCRIFAEEAAVLPSLSAYEGDPTFATLNHILPVLRRIDQLRLRSIPFGGGAAFSVSSDSSCYRRTKNRTTVSLDIGLSISVRLRPLDAVNDELIDRAFA